jgi:hypothetical protein
VDEQGAKHTLPELVFMVIPDLYPFFISLLKRCNLDGPEFFVLSSVRRSDNKLDGRPARLLFEIRETLETLVGPIKRRSKTAVPSKHWAYEVVDDLFEGGLVNKRDITDQERRSSFPSIPGGKDKAVILTIEGEKVLDRFNERVDELYRELVAASGVAVEIADFLARVASPAMGPSLIKAVHAKATETWKQILQFRADQITAIEPDDR